MTAVPVEKHLQLDAPPRPALRPVAHPRAHEDVQPWEIHSELVLVDPELRRRSLELLPEIDLDARLARPPEPIVLAPLAPPAPAAAPAPPATPASVETEPAVESIGFLRYMVHRVIDITRFGLAVIGAIFVLAMLSELLAR
jgi:hypothetical protein